MSTGSSNRKTVLRLGAIAVGMFGFGFALVPLYDVFCDAMGIGTLMNARGLMELIILNIGLQRGIIEPALFTIMVMMAIITTLMTTPLFERIYGSKAQREKIAGGVWRQSRCR